MSNSKKITPKDTGKVLHLVRKRLGLTQNEVSRKLSISQGALSKMENGKLEPSAIQWLEFCRMTDLSPEILWDYSAELKAEQERIKAKRRLLG